MGRNFESVRMSAIAETLTYQIKGNPRCQNHISEGFNEFLFSLFNVGLQQNQFIHK
jgi:hypothetical protein